MIWEQETPVVVMLTRTVEGERKKADVYWPAAEGEKLTFGTITTTLRTIVKLTNITIRIISLKSSKSEEEREIVHLHYTEWPDFGVPETTHKIRELIRLMDSYKERAESKGLKGPIVTHCSAGIGRCGTYLGILIGLEELVEGASFDQIDLVDIVSKMRAARTGMVQTEFQYKFIYQVLDDIVKEKQLKQLKSSGKRISLCLSYDETSDSDDLKCEPRRCSFSMPSGRSLVSSTSSISCQP
jgi:protein tyrosine phosphatase